MYKTIFKKNGAILLLLVPAMMFFSACTGSAEQSPQSDLLFTPTYYEGTLAKGSEISRDFCGEGTYFLMGDEAYLLRSNTEEFELYQSATQDSGTVSLPLEFPPEDTMYCQALLCECEQFATVLSDV